MISPNQAHLLAEKEESEPLTQAEPKNMVDEERQHSAAETCSPATAANDIPPAASDLTKENIVDEAKDGATIKPQSDPEMQEQDRQTLPSKVNFIALPTYLPHLSLLIHLTSRDLSLTLHGRPRSWKSRTISSGPRK